MDLFTELLYQNAGQLLDMLNDGLKPKEQYHPIATYEEKGITVFICGNKEEQRLMCNALDFEGNIPRGFSACWRLHQLVQHDLESLRV